MTNKSNSRQHGGHEINQRRPKTSPSQRTNKAKARIRREALREKGLNC